VTQKNRDNLGNIEQILALAPGLLELLKGVQQVELDNFSMEIGDLELFIPRGTFTQAGQTTKKDMQKARPTELIDAPFLAQAAEYQGKVREVTLGATKSEGGSRGRVFTIGGATMPAYSAITHPPIHDPVIALDVFDMDIPLPRVLKEHIREVMHDPAEWARFNVDKLGADMVTVHLMSTDPLIKDTPPADAVRTIEEVLQAVDVPLIVGGCGDPKKDAEVFTRVADMADGERLLFNSVTLNMAEQKTLEKVATATCDHGHVVLAFSPLELNSAKELNRRLYEYLPPDQIVMDLTTSALGYGLEYSFSIYERARYAALMGDDELSHPVISAPTNAWAAREAWMQLPPEYGSRQLRGPLWETVNALTLLLAGVDLFLIMHPAAVRTLRGIIHQFATPGQEPADRVQDWTGVRV
jgi:acetyl-CoA decarbonylase/synthase complex subunit delta